MDLIVKRMNIKCIDALNSELDGRKNGLFPNLYELMNGLYPELYGRTNGLYPEFDE